MIKVRHMAQVCREAMGAVQEFVGRQFPVMRWEDLNDRQRRLSCNVVNHILANPDVTPEACHNAWMGVMQSTEGFVYGEITSETGKTHADLVPFEQLREGSKLAYALSIGVVRGLQSIQHRYENGVYPLQQAFTPAEIDAIKAGGPSDVHFTGHNMLTPALGPEVVLGIDHAAPGGDRTVEQVVDQVVESTDEPTATDPATAE